MSKAIVTFSDGRSIIVNAVSTEQARNAAYRIERSFPIVSVVAA